MQLAITANGTDPEQLAEKLNGLVNQNISNAFTDAGNELMKSRG